MLPKCLRPWARCLLLSVVLTISTAQAAPFPVTIGTSLLAGAQAILAFDFIEGGPPANTVSILNFSTDGTLGVASTMGDVSGTLPGQVTLGDTSFFNEYAQAIALGNVISFIVDASSNAPDSGSFPDAFSFFLLDPTTWLSLVTTSDPTGANALFLYSIGEPNPLTIYDSPEVTVSVPSVPEPPTVLLMVTALAIATLRFAPRRQRKVAAARTS